MKKLSGSSYSLILVILIAFASVIFVLDLKYFASKLLPIVIGTLVALMAIWTLYQEISASQKKSDGEPAMTGSANMKKLGYIGAWVAGFALGLYVVGFLAAIFLFISSYSKFHGSSWATSIISAVVCTAVIHLIFNVALSADLYRGLLFM